ncbi:MAG: hypothetical protein AAFS11_00725 [Planctomycetota bacterium]
MSDRVTILHLGEGESRQAWKEALADRPWESGTLIKKDGEREVRRASMLDSNVAVKIRPAERLRTALIGNEHTKHVTAARLLARTRVQTAAVRCVARVAKQSVLVTGWLEGRTLLECLADSSEVERGELFRQVGGIVGMQLGGELFNRDNKPSNVIVISGAEREMALVDIAGVRRVLTRTRRSAIRYVARMCSSLAIEPRGLGIAVSEVDLEAAAYAAVISYCSVFFTDEQVADLCMRATALTLDLVAAHGDATPKVNPLNPPTP